MNDSDIGTFSWLSIREEKSDEIFKLKCKNSSVKTFEHPEKWVFFFESSEPIGDEIVLLSAGIHWDELAWVRILDMLRMDIFSGKINLKKHVCFIDGNLRAMDQAMQVSLDGKIPESRYWDADKKYGLEANANRMWDTQKLKNASNYWSYAAKRRGEIWRALNEVLLAWSDTNNFTGNLIHTDIHQSFSVPTVKEVRWEYGDDSEYTYGMAYESDTIKSINLLRKKFGDVYAGLVISNPNKAETFAAITAREFQATSVTAELGSIGSRDNITYADKMYDALKKELTWYPRDLSFIPVDIWKQIQTIIRKQDSDFWFRNIDGSSISAIQDFVPTENDVLIQNDDISFTAKSPSSFLFMNQNVVIGDRAWVMIEKQDI